MSDTSNNEKYRLEFENPEYFQLVEMRTTLMGQASKLLSQSKRTPHDYNRINSMFRLEELNGRCKYAHSARELRLNELAPLVEPKKGETRICHRVSFAATYSTQTQAEKYAEGTLVPMRDRLAEFEMEPEIIRVEPEEIGLARFELWAFCPIWMFDAISRTLPINPNCIASWVRFGVNPKVYGIFSE